jgi:hypothetical protein
MRRRKRKAIRIVGGRGGTDSRCDLEQLEARLLLSDVSWAGGDGLALAVPVGGQNASGPVMAALASTTPPTVRVSAANRGKASETDPTGRGKGHFVITRTGSTAAALTVSFDVSGSATAGDDFVPMTTSAVIPIGKTSVTVDLVPVDDAIAESDETVIMTLRQDANYVIDSARALATVTIADNEPIVKITASGKPSETDPAGKGKIRLQISRSGGDVKQALEVHLAVNGGATANVDFVAPSDPITIPATKKSITIDLPVIDDTEIEGPETVTFALADATYYHIDAKRPAVTRTIADDEPYVDLRVTSANLSTKTLNLDARVPKFSISASVLNVGTVAAAAMPVHFWLVDTGNLDHTIDLGAVTLSKGIKAGKSAKINVTIPVSALSAAPARGSYQLKALADASALPVVELKPEDNVLTGSTMMQVAGSTTMRFQRQAVMDDDPDIQMIGGKAASYLVPNGWDFSGKVVWRVNPTAPASLSVRVSNPTNLDAVEIFPPGQFIYGSGLGAGTFFPVGAPYYGNEVQPVPADVLTMITLVVLPRLRKDVSYEVVEQEETPLYAQAVRAEYPADSASTTTTVTAGRVRIEYDVEGQTVQEDFYCALSVMHMNLVNMTYWGADRPLAMRAAKGQLDADSPIMLAIAQSETIDKNWYNKYMQLLQIMLNVQLQNIQSVGQLSQYISQTSNEISDMIMDAYWTRSAAEDAIHESFLNYVNDVDVYYDPYDQRSFEFPSGYEDAWVNSLGDYVLSSNVNYNPNVSLGGSWHKVERQ